jgi:hypothetical protein
MNKTTINMCVQVLVWAQVFNFFWQILGKMIARLYLIHIISYAYFIKLPWSVNINYSHFKISNSNFPLLEKLFFISYI